jgi:D-alanyl-D-alanine carboxypeptidase
LLVAVTVASLLLVGCSDDDGDDASGDDTTTSTTEAPDASVTVATIGPELPPEVTGQLQDALDSTMEEFDVPGAVVGVWVPDQGEWIVAEGLADVDEETPMTSDMHFPIRSVTKSFTVTALLQLADEGELSLDDTIDEYVDDVPNGDEITLQQLADMTSGVADYTQSDEFIEGFIDDPTRQYTLEELNEIALNGDPAFDPGEDNVYSNTSTNLLGVVIEEVTGQSIDEIITERFIEPLQLSATTYPTDDADYPDPHPLAYSPDPDTGELHANPEVFSSLGASGAMIGEVTDLRTWVESLASGELVESETHAARMEAAEPLSEGPEYDAYGTGLGTLEGWWGHTGEGLGITALAMHDTTSGATVVILMNYSQRGNHVPTSLFREFAGILRQAGMATPTPFGGADSTTTTAAGDTTTTAAN